MCTLWVAAFSWSYLSIWKKKKKATFLFQCKTLQHSSTSSAGAVQAQTLLGEETSTGDLLRKLKPLRLVALPHLCSAWTPKVSFHLCAEVRDELTRGGSGFAFAGSTAWGCLLWPELVKLLATFTLPWRCRAGIQLEWSLLCMGRKGLTNGHCN